MSALECYVRLPRDGEPVPYGGLVKSRLCFNRSIPAQKKEHFQ